MNIPDADAHLSRGGLNNPPDGKVLPKDAPAPAITTVGPKAPWIFGGEKTR